MGPDDFHDHVNDNAYTNAAASLAIHWGRYMTCMCQFSDKDGITEDDVVKALHLKLPYEYRGKVHHQYDGYQNGEYTKYTISMTGTRMVSTTSTPLV